MPPRCNAGRGGAMPLSIGQRRGGLSPFPAPPAAHQVLAQGRAITMLEPLGFPAHNPFVFPYRRDVYNGVLAIFSDLPEYIAWWQDFLNRDLKAEYMLARERVALRPLARSLAKAWIRASSGEEKAQLLCHFWCAWGGGLYQHTVKHNLFLPVTALIIYPLARGLLDIAEVEDMLVQWRDAFWGEREVSNA